MPSVRRDNELSNRHHKRMAATVTVGLVFFLIGLIFHDSNLVVSMVCFTGFALACVTGIRMEMNYLNRFRCPSCTDLLPRKPAPERKPGERILFHCERCDVLWDSGCREYDGSGG